MQVVLICNHLVRHARNLLVVLHPAEGLQSAKAKVVCQKTSAGVFLHPIKSVFLTEI